jgi:hypothetical protein
MHGASFLGQTTIRTQQIMLRFYRSVQITSQLIYVTRLITTSLHGKSIAITIFLSEVIENLAIVAENDAIFGLVTSSTM